MTDQRKSVAAKVGIWNPFFKYSLALLVAASGWAMWFQERITRYDPVRIEIHGQRLEAYRQLSSALHNVAKTAARHTEGGPAFAKDLNSAFEPLSYWLGRDNILIDKDTNSKIQALIHHCLDLVEPPRNYDFQKELGVLIRQYDACIQAMRRALGTDQPPIDLASHRKNVFLLEWTYIVSIILGGGITFVLSWYFFRKASVDLRQKVQPLAKQIDLVLRGLEEAGIIEFNRDEEGNYIGIVMHIESGPVEIKFSGGASHTFTPSNEQQAADRTNE